MEEKVAEAKIW